MPFRKRHRWPDSQESTGVYLATIGRDKLGRDCCCWEAKGKARTVFNTLQGDISKYIDQTCESLPKDVVWSLYMVGRRRETANPTITFISCEPGSRQRLRTLIKESTLLDKYPGFVTMDIDRPPGCKSSVIKTLGLHESELISNDAQLQQISLFFPSTCIMGASIFLKERGQTLVATGGGLVQCNGKVFMTSVAHPFEKFWTDRFPKTIPARDYIFDVDEISDSEEEDEKLVDVTSPGSIATHSTLSGANDCSLGYGSDIWTTSPHILSPLASPTTKPSSNATTVPSRANSRKYHDFGNVAINNDQDEDSTQIAELRHNQGSHATTAAPDVIQSANLHQVCDISGPTISSANGGTFALDYSLFELSDSIVKTLRSTALGNNLQRTPTSVPREPRSIKVVVHTTSGPVAGRLLATSSFMQPAQGMLSQQLWTVFMEGTLQNGLCGSWVVDSLTEDVLGHIIAGAPKDGFAYIIPFYEILDDLNLHFGDGWTLADPINQSAGIDTGDNMLPRVQECSPPQVAMSRGSSQTNRRKKKNRKNRNTRFCNSWCTEFSTPRRISNEQSLAQTRKKLDADGDDLRIFFLDSQDTMTHVEVEGLARFCRGTSFKAVEGGRGLAGSQRSLWLDERNNFPGLKESGKVREHENPLTATGALRALGQPRFNHEKLPDAARRLIYVTDLSPAYIHALAATASPLDAHVLRNAIYKHLGFQPSIAVNISSMGCLTFQLELHLPFLILRKSIPLYKAHDNKKPDRGWTDLSFLKLDVFSFDIYPTEPNEVWSLQEAQISCVVTGTDDWRWTGYGFVDAEVDGLLGDASECEMSFDQIAAGEIDARFSIWEPRGYWVRVFEIRIRRIRDEYENLIRKLEIAVTQYMNDHPSTLLRQPGTTRNQTTEMKVAFDWTLQMIGLLGKIHNVLLPTTKVWQTFSSDDGDIAYFDEYPATKSIISRHRSMHNIKAIFSQFDKYQEEIVVLIKKCSDYRENLTLRLTLDIKEAADKNLITASFALLFLYPVVLGAVIFSMQQELIPFTLSPKSFLLTVIILMVMVYIARLFGGHVLSSLQNKIGWWIERGESGVVNGMGQYCLIDEERVTPKTLKEQPGLLSWTTSWRTIYSKTKIR